VKFGRREIGETISPGSSAAVVIAGIAPKICPQQRTQSDPDFIEIGSLSGSAELQPNA